MVAIRRRRTIVLLAQDAADPVIEDDGEPGPDGEDTGRKGPRFGVEQWRRASPANR